VALCDASGAASDVFETGSDAIFYYEFTTDDVIDTPVGGISLVNERNLIVHGRNSLQCGVPAPPTLAAGARLRFRQRIRLDLSPGRYSFVVGLASVPSVLYAQAAYMSHAALHNETVRVLSVGNVGWFTVTLRRDGLELPFHGLCALDGDTTLEVGAAPPCEAAT
jgi:hypothetical protein